MLQYFIQGFLILLLAMPADGFSQNEAFQRLAVGGYLGHSFSENTLTESWDPSPSLQFNLQTPFYAGLLEGGIRYTRFDNSPDYPSYSDFHFTFVYIGWGYLFDIGNKFSAGPLLRFGNTFFHFDEAKIYTPPNSSSGYNFDTNESEFTYELLLHNEFRITPNWNIHAELVYNRTLTFHPIKLASISVGLTYSFDSPSWFQKVFK